MIRSFSISLALAVGFGLTSLAQVPGCTNLLACNFDFWATEDDGSCTFCCDQYVDLSGTSTGGIIFVCGCTDPLACNFDFWATEDDGSCTFCCAEVVDFSAIPIGGVTPVCGCTDPNACNYDSEAWIDDGSCHVLCQYCKEGTVWDEALQGCIVANPADINLDGCVQLNDLLDLLTAYGDCGDEEPPWQCGDPLEYQGYEYETVQIGEQCWFAENLRNENYLSGDAIANNLSDIEWSTTASGASAVYGEGNHMCGDFAPNGDACDEVFALNEYGRLYNWHAVDSPLGLCPSSWHVASDAEWMDLEMHLGMSATEVNLTGFRGGNEGTSLKAIAGWFSSGGGDNSSGFSARPGGLRAGSGDTQFINGGGGTSFWTSSKDPGELPWHRGLTAVSASAEQINRNNIASSNMGYSVRCIKDTE